MRASGLTEAELLGRDEVPPLLEPGEFGLDAADLNGSGGAASVEVAGRPFALALEDFIAAREDAPPPLVGAEDDCLLPAHGLLLVAAKGGKGKTTSTIDAVLHFASGLDWLGWPVQRPLRVLFLENEGPREPFRRKLERRLENWPHPITGAVFVYDESWGQGSLKDAAWLARLNAFTEQSAIDLIVADPLDSFGMDGNGSPEETREMVDRFKAGGLFTKVAWWVLHHARKERTDDAIDEAAGAWGGRPDALLGLEKLEGNRSRLGFHKLRWGRRDGFSYLLAFDPDTESFELIVEDGDEDRDYAAEVADLLADGRPRRVAEISKPTEKGGVGAAQGTIRDALKADPARFVSFTGAEAKAHGFHPNATVWGLTSASNSDKSDGPDTYLPGVLAEGLTSDLAYRGQKTPEPDPNTPGGLTSHSESDRPATPEEEAEVERLAEKFGGEAGGVSSLLPSMPAVRPAEAIEASEAIER